MRTPATPLGFGLLSLLLRISTASQVRLGSLGGTREDPVDASFWCDRGCYEFATQQTYRSFNGAAPKLKVLVSDERCDGGLTFLEPYGWQAYGSGAATYDDKGDLIWKPTQWAGVRDMKVQRFDDALYMTFWIPDEGSGVGHYIMLDDTYRVFKEIRPAGGMRGDVKNLLITSNGTAILTIDPETRTHSFRAGSTTRRNYGSVFQEIDLHSDKLIFEWHAMDHLNASESIIDSKGSCRSGRHASDDMNPFSIVAMDKNPESGAYLISSPCTRTISSVSAEDGHLQWQLGGAHNSFSGLSDDLATALAVHQHASWDTLGDSAYPTLSILSGGRGVIVRLDLGEMAVVSASVPQGRTQPLSTYGDASPAQVLPNGNVLLSGGVNLGFTEYSRDGKQLCEMRLDHTRGSTRKGRGREHRASKFPWVGRPHTKPSIVVRPETGGDELGGSLYVSWNGATEVGAWVLQSGPSADGNAFINHCTVERHGFETRIPLPLNSENHLRVLALDKDRRFIGTSDSVPRQG